MTLNPFHHSQVRSTSVALLVGLFVSGPAFGAFAPGGFSVAVVSTAGSTTPTNTVAPVSATTWAATGGWTFGGASVSWTNNTQGWNPLTSTGFTSGNVVIRNESAAAQDYTITIGMTGVAAGPLVVSGSVGGQFLNTSFGLGSLTSSGPLWSALVDGANARNEFNNTLVFAQPFQIISLGNANFSNVVVPTSTASTLAIRLSVRMSAGSEASFTSSFAFQAVPAPGAIALITVAGMFGRRLRRR